MSTKDSSLRDTVYRTVRDKITYGKVNSGERLIEANLAEEFGASRSPIREALRQLESEGLVTFERNKGITVSRLSVKQVDEIYDIKIVLASHAARLAVAHCTPEDVVYLRQLNTSLSESATKGDLQMWLDDNRKFHDFFPEHSGNESLVEILDLTQRRVYRYRYMIVMIPGHFDEYLEHHFSIIRACEEKNLDAAEENMKLHLQRTRTILIEYLNTFPELSF